MSKDLALVTAMKFNSQVWYHGHLLKQI